MKIILFIHIDILHLLTFSESMILMYDRLINLVR